MDRNKQCYYLPAAADQPINSVATWHETSQGNVKEAVTSLPDQCTCATLQMRDHRDGDQLISGVCSERQSLYSSIKSN